MKLTKNMLPTAVTMTLIGAALIHGPVAQLPHYHEFADQTQRFGIEHFADVVSNLGFLLVALWGFASLAPLSEDRALAHGWGGYRLFLLGLLLTAFGSAWYHLAPDNARLVWDRLPITFACGGLLAGAWGDSRERDSSDLAGVLAMAGVASVAWWHSTEIIGTGDLRPYLLLQALPFVLIPLWQWLHGADRYDRWFFGAALVLYAAAKWAELNDHEIGAVVGFTGHTLKHVLATLSCAAIVATLNRRVRRATQQTAAVACVQ